MYESVEDEFKNKLQSSLLARKPRQPLDLSDFENDVAEARKEVLTEIENKLYDVGNSIIDHYYATLAEE